MENYLRDAMVSLSSQGIENAALVHQSNIGFKSHDETYQSGNQRFSVTRAAVWAKFLFTPISPTFGWLLNRVIKQQRPDILHLHMPNVSVFWALLIPRARRLPWVVHWHSDVVASRYSLGLRVFYTLYRPFEKAVLERAKAIITTSPPYLESSEPLRAFKAKCHIVPLGLNPAAFEATPTDNIDTAHQTRPLQVLAIGRLTYYKGFEYLIHAAAKTDNIEVHIVGSGEQEDELKALTQQLYLNQIVHFHGSLSHQQLVKQLQGCDCLCLPSIERTEAFGMVLLEAMTCGKATIVSNVPGSGMGWVVDEGETGLLVQPEDAVALNAALQNLEQHRDKMRLFGQNGRNKFDQYFHIGQSSRGLSKVYQLILRAET